MRLPPGERGRWYDILAAVAAEGVVEKFVGGTLREMVVALRCFCCSYMVESVYGAWNAV